MRRVLKWIGIVLGGLLGLLVVAVLVLWIYGNSQFKATHEERPLYSITADTSPEGLARGAYLMEEAMLCTEACHANEGAGLSGVAADENFGPVFVRFATPNLTPHETGLGDWSDAEIARAIREGVDKDGIGLVFMPSYTYNVMSDADAAAVVAYLRNLDPVENEVPPVEGNWAAKVMFALGMFGEASLQEPITEPQVAPPEGSVAYGQYMVGLGGCIDCHQPNLAGGPLPFAGPGDVPAANLTPAGELPGWDVEDFIGAVTEGRHPSGRRLDEGMPRYGTSEEDLAAIFAYLQTLPPTPTNQ